MRNKALAVTMVVVLGLLVAWTAMVSASLGELEFVGFPTEVAVTGEEVQLEGELKFNEKEYEYAVNIRLWVTGHEGRIEPNFIAGPLYDGETVPITVYLEGVPGATTLHADDLRCPYGTWPIQLTQATPTSTPSPTATSTPAPTSTATPTPTSTPVDTATPTPTPTGTSTPRPSTPTPTPTVTMPPPTEEPRACTGWVSVKASRCEGAATGVVVTLRWEGGQFFGSLVTEDGANGEVLFLFVPPGRYYAEAENQRTALFNVVCGTKVVSLTLPCH